MKPIRAFRFTAYSLICLIATGCGQAWTDEMTKNWPDQRGVSEAAIQNEGTTTLATYYYLPIENPDEQRSVRLYHASTHALLGLISPSFKVELMREGSGKLSSGLVVNYTSRAPDGINALPVDAEWGQGYTDEKLVPFQSIAVSPNQIPLRSWVYISETKGMPLPDGSQHDGYWRAVDTGSAVKYGHIDFFVGKKEWAVYLEKFGISGNVRLTIQTAPNGFVH